MQNRFVLLDRFTLMLVYIYTYVMLVPHRITGYVRYVGYSSFIHSFILKGRFGPTMTI